MNPTRGGLYTVKVRASVYSIIGVLASLLAAAPASADIYTFNCITNNAQSCAIGEAQLSVNVQAAGANQVSFTFNNSGPLASSITDIYFDERGE
jgi:hypothetical protein